MIASPAPAASSSRRALRLLAATLAVYALLVGTHAGEFWPFSIYPMFSKAGRPWQRTLVREVSATPPGPANPMAAPAAWAPLAGDALPGRPYALIPRGIEPVDLADMINKTRRWDDARIGTLHRLFYDQFTGASAGRRLLVVRAEGRVESGDSVGVVYRPFAVVTRDTVLLRPDLPR